MAPLKKDTEDSSGSFRLASPLACSGWASAIAGSKRESRKAKEPNLATRDQRDATLAGQMRMRIPPMMTEQDNCRTLGRVSAAKFAPSKFQKRCRIPNTPTRKRLRTRVGGTGPWMPSARLMGAGNPPAEHTKRTFITSCHQEVNPGTNDLARNRMVPMQRLGWPSSHRQVMISSTPLLR